MKVALKIFVTACLMTGSVFAQPAPVYDIDSLQPAPYVDPEQTQEATVTVVPGPMQMSDSNQQFIPQDGADEPQSNMPMDQRIVTNQGPDQLESLQTQVQDLRGQVEKLTHDLSQLQKRNLASAETEKPITQLDQPQPAKEMVNDVLDTPSVAPVVAKPLNKAENKNVGPIEKLDINAAKNNQIDVDEEQQIYQSAYNLIKTKKYADAVVVLQQMLNKYPKGQFASNAHYWLGELFGLQGNTDKALEQFSVIIKNYPKSPRISDAQLKVGLILASQLKWSEAKGELKKVIRQYPGTSSAKIAMEQLKQIKQAGH